MALSTYDIGIIVSVTILTIIGLILYLVSLPALISIYRSSHLTFYILMISLSIPEIIWLVLTLIYSIPTMIVGISLFGTVTERIMGNIDTIVYFMQMTHLFFIAINRLRFVGRSKTETFDKVFTSKKVYAWCSVLWIFSIGIKKNLCCVLSKIKSSFLIKEMGFSLRQCRAAKL